MRGQFVLPKSCSDVVCSRKTVQDTAGIRLLAGRVTEEGDRDTELLVQEI